MFKLPGIEQILFATDLSENANLAMDYAMSMAGAYDARITVLHVLEKMPPNAEMLMAPMLGYESVNELRQKSEEELVERIREHIQQFCAEAVGKVARECRIAFHKVLVEPGKAAERILDHAGSGEYDVLVMGSHGLGLLHEAFMGGTSRKILDGCPIPVLVIPMKLESS